MRRLLWVRVGLFEESARCPDLPLQADIRASSPLKATGTIPIIFPTAFDLVGVGLAESLPRPGGNVTGFALLVPEVSAKGLTLLQEAVPGLRKVAVIWNGANAANAIVRCSPPPTR